MRKYVIVGLLLLLLLGAAVYLTSCKGAYVGSTMSNKYHDPSCVWAKEIDGDRKIWFGDAAEAEAAGYVPCETCLGGEVSE